MANSQGYSVSQSMWALDAVENFQTSDIYNSSDAGNGAAGELQNDYSLCTTGTLWDTDFHMKVNIDDILNWATTPLKYGNRLYNSKLDSGNGGINARTFAEYAVGSAASGTLASSYSISAWVYPANYGGGGNAPDGCSPARRYHIVSFQSSDHLTASTGPVPATCSVSLFLTGSDIDSGTEWYVGTETVLSSSLKGAAGDYIVDLATSSIATCPVDEWSHILCCYDATTAGPDSLPDDRIRLYINGELADILYFGTNGTGDNSAFYGEIHPSTGAIGNNAGLNLEPATLTGNLGPGGGLPYPSDQYFINNVFQGRLTEISFFNYSLYTLDQSLPSLMYNNGCPPAMHLMSYYQNIQHRPIGYYRCGGTIKNVQESLLIPGPPTASISGPGDMGYNGAAVSAWDPDTSKGTTGLDLRHVNAVPYYWEEQYPYSLNLPISNGSRLYPMGDGYMVTEQTGAVTTTFQTFQAGAVSGPCKDGYVQTDKTTLMASPIYNRKHTLGSVFSVTHFGWTPYTPSKTVNNFTEDTLTMPIPEASASISEWSSNILSQPIAVTTLRAYPLGNIQACGGSAEWQAGMLAGSVIDGVWVSSSQTPFYNSYDDYNQHMRLKNHDYSVIPEFLISDQVDTYFNKQNGDFLAPNPSQFGIKGSETSSTSNIPSNSSEDAFYETFSNSDFLRNFSLIKQDHKGFADPTTITLKCKALMKFLPYDGFYPSERSLQIAHQFSKSYGEFVEYEGSDRDLVKTRMRPFLSPFFRPGIIYNTIKSGLAVDYPIYTSSYKVINYRSSESVSPTFNINSPYYCLGTQDSFSASVTFPLTMQTASWDFRIPFEAVVDPERYIRNMPIYDLEPHPSNSIDIQARWTGEGDILYKRMMHNYLAAIPEFFLQNKEFTNLKSKPQNEFLTVQSGTSYGMRVKVRSTMNKPRSWPTSDSQESVLQGDIEVPQHPRIRRGPSDNLRETFTMYSRPSAFGPPVAATDYFGYDGSKATDSPVNNWFNNTKLFPSDSLMGINPSFCPAPIGGEAWYDIIWNCKQDGQVSIDQIFSEATINKWRIDTDPILKSQFTASNPGVGLGTARSQAIWSANQEDIVYNSPMMCSYANAYAMQLDASFNILGKKQDRWIIEPKFETPHYNFNSEASIRPLTSASNTLTIPTNGSESVPRGMWHQFGTIETDKGIYLDVGPIPEKWRTIRGYADLNRVNYDGADPYRVELLSGIDLSVYQNDNFKDLSLITGFENTKKLGNTAESLTVSEAIVAVPFTIEDGEKKFFRIPKDVIRRALGDLNTISSDKAVSQAGLAVKAALKGLEENEDLLGNLSDQKAAKVRAAAGAASAAASNQLSRDEDTSDKISNTIKDMVSKMKKFVFPPNMDFVNNPDKVEPFSMYIFEFDYQFTQTDLAYMWQNVAPPERSKKFEQKEVEITHKLYANELMGSFGNGDNDPIKDGLQWMVFKVKQRANNNYFSKVSSVSGPKADQFAASYNWPYDFFSLVEFANMDAKIGFGKSLKQKDEDQRVAEVRENPLKLAKKVKGRRKKSK